MKLLPTVLLLLAPTLPAQQLPYQNPSVSPDTRINDLLSRMTLEEKVDAFGTNPTVPRLGIVGTGHVEGLHGLALGGPGHWEGHNGETVIPTTTFPQARGLGQTWDPELLEQAAALEAYETRYAFGKYHRGGLVVRAPNADLSRDPRWGRSEESYGEDPFLVGTLATAFTRGLQGSDPKTWETSSLLKHFLANSNEDNRDGSSSDFDTRLFHEYYSVPFRMAIEDGHADAMMASYNAWNHVPMTENPALRDIVMRQWGFDGILCTDAGALTNMVTHHKVFNTMPEATAAAIHAGINQFLDKYRQPLEDALKQHLVTEADLDSNLRGVFRVMLRLGMLDPATPNPYNTIGLRPDALTDLRTDPWMTPTPRALVRRATEESVVLLKNDRNTLPLNASGIHSVAVIGPLSDTVVMDWYSGTAPSPVTPLAGIRARLGSGVNVTSDTSGDPAQAAALAKAADVAVVIIGNHPTCYNPGWAKCPNPSDGREAVDRKSLTLQQEDLARAALAANPRTVVVLQTSFPYTTTWTEEHIPAILELTHNSEEQGTALAAALFGDFSPAGRLTQTWVAAESDLPPMMDYDIRHGRTYMYGKSKPLYPFGFGLSYTTFRYADLAVDHPTIALGTPAKVTLKVTNSGPRDGDEVVQLYASFPHSAVSRPQQQLVAFKRVSLRKGQTETVTLTLDPKTLSYWNDAAGKLTLEPGPVELRAGASSADIRLHTTVNAQRQ